MSRNSYAYARTTPIYMLNFRIVRRFSSAFLFLLVAEGIFAADLVDFGMTNTFSTDCLVTKVEVTEESVAIEFLGRWQCDALLARFADTERNAVALARKAGDDAEWDRIAGAAKAAENHRATITVKSPGLLMRGGIPFFEIPPAKVEITVAP